MDHLEHGRLTTYVNGRCRCIPCSAAAREYARRRAYGQLPALVPLAQIVDHLAWLSSHGIGWEQVASLTGLPRSTVSAIRYPVTRRRGITPRVAGAVLAVLPTMDNAADAALIPAAGTQRRLGALMLQGHTLRVIQDALGVTALGRVFARDRVTAHLARRVRDYFDTYWATPATARSRYEAAAIARTIARATAAGYLPAMAWDEDLLDDPAATPVASAVRSPQRGVRIHLEDVEFLGDQGATWDDVCARTGASRNSIEIACARAGRRELVARITNNRWVAA